LYRELAQRFPQGGEGRHCEFLRERLCIRKEGKPVSRLDPRQTLITLPDEIPWQVPDVAPPDSVAEAVLAGAEEQEGSYLVLMKWFPGWMSAPHTYVTDRLCVVVSGVGGVTAARTSTRPMRSRFTQVDSCDGWQERHITMERWSGPPNPRSSR
jgi:hypothetical protein